MFSGNIQRSTNPNSLNTLVGNINTIKQCSMGAKDVISNLWYPGLNFG